jgi:membrane-bound metal-dependent hydrolase YbcI (DUF457 family)
MKGIAHFLTGLALASFFPDVIHAAANGSLLPVLGGLGGLLPDTLDFKFVQFWEKYDIEINPGPEPDAEVIADIIVKAINQAWTSGEPIHVRAHTIRLGADTWRRYTLEFYPDTGEISVKIGPVVTTSQKPYPSSEFEPFLSTRRKVDIPFLVPYSHHYDIDIFHGPSFLFIRESEFINIRFLDWHRRWTHSLLLAPVVGVCIALFIGVFFNKSAAIWAGIVSALGFTAHVLEDQLGTMGCNLWWPLSRHRRSGAGLYHSSDSLPNFVTVWLSLVLILYNLDRYAGISYLPRVPYLLIGLGGVIGVTLLTLLLQFRRTNEAPLPE